MYLDYNMKKKKRFLPVCSLLFQHLHISSSYPLFNSSDHSAPSLNLIGRESVDGLRSHLSRTLEDRLLLGGGFHALFQPLH